MKTPTITRFSSSQKFRYLWLKYVTGFNLGVHCAQCLKGNYSKKIAPTGVKAMIALDEYNATYFYLCGVTTPYKWEDNLHLAFRFKEGSRISYDNGKGTIVEIKDAERIEIIAQPTYCHPRSNNKAYTTCRNWQFAYQMTYHLNENASVN